MTATAHALIGGAIAAAIPQPEIALPLAVASHLILDMVPHWDVGLNWKKKNKVVLFAESMLDLTVGILAAFLIFGRNVNPFYLLACIAFAESFDILMMPYLLFGWKFPPFSTSYNLQHKIQEHAKLAAPWGIISQIFSVTGVALALRLVH